MSYRVYCLYGLNNDHMNMQSIRSQDHQYHKIGQIAKGYFQNLFPYVKQETFDDNDLERPVVLVINPSKFIQRVKDVLVNMGV